jgi:hypothetical protein
VDDGPSPIVDIGAGLWEGYLSRPDRTEQIRRIHRRSGLPTRFARW